MEGEVDTEPQGLEVPEPPPPRILALPLMLALEVRLALAHTLTVRLGLGVGLLDRRGELLLVGQVEGVTVPLPVAPSAREGVWDSEGLGDTVPSRLALAPVLPVAPVGKEAEGEPLPVAGSAVEEV